MPSAFLALDLIIFLACPKQSDLPNYGILERAGEHQTSFIDFITILFSFNENKTLSILAILAVLPKTVKIAKIPKIDNVRF